MQSRSRFEARLMTLARSTAGAIQSLVAAARRAVKRPMQQFARALLAAFAMSSLMLTACKVADSEKREEPSSKQFGLGDLLCTYTPAACNGDKLTRFYAAEPGTIYERKLDEHPIYVPIGYVDDTDLLVDPRPGHNWKLHLIGLLPDLTPRTPANIADFFTPRNRSVVRIWVVLPNEGAKPWSLAAIDNFNMTLHAANSPTRRPNKFGLEVWGEDYERWPKRRPCADADENDPPCGEGATEDALRPIKPNGPPSVMKCEPDILADTDAYVMALTAPAREAYFASKKWFGRRRAMCTHDMLYEPWGAHVVLEYPRRFIAQWQQTEQKVRALLDSIQQPPQTPPPAVWWK